MGDPMKDRFQLVMLLHECISFTLKSMNCDLQTETENLRKAIDTAQKGLEMLNQHLMQCEIQRPN